MSAAQRVVVVGAGVGGLAAAHRLVEIARKRDCRLELTVLDAAERAGGVAESERHDGFLFERGPDSMVTHKPAGLALCRRLGLAGRLVDVPAGRTDIVLDSRAHPIPVAFALLAPARVGPLLASPLLSWRGKLRALGERFVAPGDAADESVAAFVRRRFGNELLGRLVEPIVGAIYMADLERLSLAATFPRFLALEREHGSVTRGLTRRMPAAASAARRSAAPAVVALQGGVGELVDALVAALPAGALRTATPALGLRCDGDAWAISLAEGRSIAADAVLIATPAHAAADLVAEFDSELAETLGATPYASCASLHLAWPLRAIARPPASQGFFVPRGNGGEVVAGTFVHVKFPERVTEGRLVARTFLGGALHPEAAARSDEELVAQAVAALTPQIAPSEPPAWFRVHRHEHVLPQPGVGHLGRVEHLRALAARYPGLELAGGPVGAYGLPDVIAAGEAAAERLLDRLSSAA